MMNTVIAQQLWFTRPYEVEVRRVVLPPLKPGEVLVQTEASAVSAGTELLVYRGQLPTDMVLDANIESLQSTSAYPLHYGYASVGRVIGVATADDNHWLGQRIFAFQPHASHFIARSANLIAVPDDISADGAVFLANMETAVSLVHDGAPRLGEQVVVLGQGVVGLLVSSLLTCYPLSHLFAVDGMANRRERALGLGVSQVFDPSSGADVKQIQRQLTTAGADLIFEISGVPEALNLAIELSGFTSRIVIGSWYGNKSAAITLGGEAHSMRIVISTSQVSTIAPELSGRWDKARRFNLTWQLIRQRQPEHLISHRVDLDDAARLYQTLENNPGEILQAVFTYS